MLKRYRHLASLLLMSLALTAHAAENWKIIMPFAPGGATDVLARLVADRLRQATGNNVIVENIVGANGNIGAAAAAKAKPDGTTILITSEAYATVNPILFKDSMRYEPASFVPVSMLGEQMAVLVTSPASGLKKLQDFMAKAKGPGVSYSSAGIGSTSHLATGYLSTVAGGLNLIHVPFAGGAPAINAILGNQVEAGFIIAGNVMPHVRAGKLIPLAVSGKNRLKLLPDVPTIAESGYPDYSAIGGVVALVPAATPLPIRQNLTKLFQEALRAPEVEQHLAANGFVTLASNSEEAMVWLNRETKLWTDLIVNRNILKN